MEGQRALAANQQLLPLPLHSLIDPDLTARGDSPAASMAVARSREAIADPPAAFGAIRARHLLASSQPGGASAPTHDQVSRRQRSQVLIELEDDEDARTSADLFDTVGGGGALGRLLQRMLEVVRQRGGDGRPGADAPTHRTRAWTRGGGNALVSTAVAGASRALPSKVAGRSTRRDVHRRRYRPDWCTVQEVEPHPTDGAPLPLSDAYGLRRSLARLGTGLDSCRRQLQGDDIDIDAAVEARVALMAGSVPDEAVYVDSLRRRRDLAVLLLLDISGSVAEPGVAGQAVHQHQRAAAAALTVALHDLGDRVALYAFHSQGRSAVHLVRVKRFDDDLDTLVMQRLHGLEPGAYSRLGAAIRHGAAVLEQRGGASRGLLVVLSDGLAYDHGTNACIERPTRGAHSQKLVAGAPPACVEHRREHRRRGPSARLGSAAHAAIPRPEQLRAGDRSAVPFGAAFCGSAATMRTSRWAH